MRFNWKIGGEAGFGIVSSGLAFSKVASCLGYHVFDWVSYPSLIRGGHNSYEVVFSEEEVCGLKWKIDFLVCLNKDTFNYHKKRLTSESLVIYDNNEFDFEENFIKIPVPFNEILHRFSGEAVMKNTIALGATLAILGSDLTSFFKIIEKQFAKKGQKMIDLNKNFAKLGYDYVKATHSSLIKPVLTKKKKEEKLILSGNDAFSLGAVIGDCRLYAAYPMTPASSVLHTLATFQEKTGMIVRHSEDEIAVINTAIGSSFAGVRSSVGTSGGGFALMVETVSLAGITEIPLVIFLASRPGPATGMPTWTGQEDLLFTVHSGHGEFLKIVLAPGDVAEMIELTAIAFNLADIYQTPVFILSDMYLSESHKTLSKKFIDDFINSYKVERGKTITQYQTLNLKNQKYLRYQITDDGISPRLIPAVSEVYYQANSYEHLEDGHTSEDSTIRKKQVEKRNKKRETYLKNHFQLPKIYGDFSAAEIVFVTWGSMKGPVLEAMKIMEKNNSKTAMIHFTHLFPLDEEKIRPIFNKEKRYILVENNYQGQFGRLLREETGIKIKEKLLKYDGRPFWPEEILEKI